jgi:hypothetical protein
MMKGFVKKGLVLMALALLVASCAPGGSQEGAASPKPDQSSSLIPITMDPANHQLTIGDGNGPGTAVVDGHSIEIVDGTSTAAVCQDDGTGNSNCWVRLWNRDTDDYMANAFVVTTKCAACTAGTGGPHIFDNADAVNVYDPAFIPTINALDNAIGALNGYTTHDFASIGSAGQLNGAGITYVSDCLNDVSPDDAKKCNPFGARLKDFPSGAVQAKPEWMIGPKCGMKSELWNFGGSNLALFHFVASVKANWFPMNPIGADLIPGTGDDDPRFDFTNFNTVYISLAALDSPGTKPGSALYRNRYRPGSFQRSTILAGYGAPGGNSVTTIVRTGAVQKYFGINVGIEASNRLELMPHASKANKQYEYYKMVATILTWNPKALIQIDTGDSWKLTKTGGSLFNSGGSANTITYQCVVALDCQNYFTSSAVELRPDYAGSGGINTTAGYIAIMNWIDDYNGNGAWQYFSPDDIYSTMNGDLIKIKAAATYNAGTPTSPVWVKVGREIPKRFGHRGFAKVKWQAGGLTDGGLHAVQMNNTGLIQDGIDAEPEAWAYMFIMKVNVAGLAPVGTGTEIKLDYYGTFTTYEYLKSNNTFDTRTLYPPQPSPPNGTNAGPAVADPIFSDDNNTINVTSGSDQIVANGVEQVNKMLRHRAPGGKFGGFQAWNVGICIQ